MDQCEHYTIRGDVAKHREREPRMNYPFTLPQGLTNEQIRKLLPLMASCKCKRWQCHQCVKEFMEQDCPHEQLAIGHAPSVAEANLDVALVTKTNGSIVEGIDSVEVLICTEDSMNAEVECITKKQQPEPKVFFDLNVPIIEPCDEALENSNNHDPAPATVELAVACNLERSITELVSVEEQQNKSLEVPETETSAKVPNNGIGNSSVSPSPGILVPGGNRRLRIKKARKYHSLSYLNEEGKREGSPNVPNSIPQYDRTELKKKKMHPFETVQEGPAGTKINEATEDGSEQNIQNRTFDCNLSPKQNWAMAKVSPSPRRESCGKRKHSVNHDQNGNSGATVSNSSEKGLQNEARSVDLQLRKRRIFCTVTKTPLANADQSQRVEPVGHKSKKNASSSSERKESLMISVADHGNSRPTRTKKATSKAAYPLMLGKKRKSKNHSEPSGTAQCPEKSFPDVVGKELVLQDRPISDVPMPCLQNDNFDLKQLKSEIKTRLLSQGVGVKRLKVDSPSANNSQNVIPTSGDRSSSATHTESGGRVKDDANLKLGAPQENKQEIDKSILKEVKRLGRPKRVPASGTKKKQVNEQPATFAKDVTALRQKLPSETALQLLSMVAVDTLENEALSDSELDDTVLPIMEEFHVPPVRNVLEMGYDGCIEVTNPADYFLVDGEGDRFKLGPEDLPLRPHRLLPEKGILPGRLLIPMDYVSRVTASSTSAASSGIGIMQQLGAVGTGQLL